jgi:hypothetical protein
MKRKPFIDIGDNRLIYRQQDRLPGLLMRIVDGFDTPVDLTEFTVALSLRRISGVHGRRGGWSEPRQCTIRDPLTGLIFYDMQPEDTNTDPGEFELLAILYDQGQRVASAPTRPDAFIQVNSMTTTENVSERLLTVNLDTPVTTNLDVHLVAEGTVGTEPTPPGVSAFMI